MKKIISFVLLTVVMTSLAVAGCAAQPAAKGGKFIFAALPPGTSYYLTAVGLSQTINRHTDLFTVVQPVPGVKPQLSAIVNGEADININPSQVWSDAFYGGRLYSLEEPAPRARFLIAGHNNYLGFITGEKSGIKSIEDLRGKRVMADAPAFKLKDTIGKTALRAYGIDPEKDITLVSSENPPHAHRLLREGKADAIFEGLGGAMMVETDAKIGAFVIPVDAEILAKATEQFPEIFTALAPTSVAGIDVETPVVAYRTVLVVRDDFPAEAARSIVEALLDNHKENVRVAWEFTQWTPQRAVYKGTVPYLPAVVEVYKERNLWSAEMDALQQKLLPK
jgi:TRAP transporter TAXI family solute receptor